MRNVQCCMALEEDGDDLIFAAHQRLERVRVAMAPERMFEHNAEIQEIAERWLVWSTSPEALQDIASAERELAKCEAECEAAEALASATAAAAVSEPDQQRPAQRPRREAAVQSVVGQNAQARENNSQGERERLVSKAAEQAVAAAEKKKQEEAANKKAAEAKRRAPPQTLKECHDVVEAVMQAPRAYSQSIIGKPDSGAACVDNLDGCEHQAIVKVARACNYMNPHVAAMADKSMTMVHLSHLIDYCPFISVEQLAGMEQEWDEYKALSAGVPVKQNVLHFFKLHQEALPTIAAVVCDLAVIPSSSVACERVFSLLRNMFGDRQYHSLQDYISTSVMLRSNKRST